MVSKFMHAGQRAVGSTGADELKRISWRSAYPSGRMGDVDKLVRALGIVELPELRLQIYGALESLSDFEYQKTFWYEHKFGDKEYDNFVQVIHVLYDDYIVLPDPVPAVGDLIFKNEVIPLRSLGESLDYVLQNNPGGIDEAGYIFDPHWPSVIADAQTVLTTFRKNGDGYGKPWTDG